MRTLVAWIGNTDLRAPSASDRLDVGPICQAVQVGHYDQVLLLADQAPSALRKYESWIRQRAGQHSKVSITPVQLTSPTNFDEIYQATTEVLDQYIAGLKARPDLTFHLSPGTPAMAAIWVILGKTRYRAELIQSSRQKGVEVASVPFDIAISPEFVKDVLRGADKQLEQLSSGAAIVSSQFGDILYSGREMGRLVERAKRAAPRSIPILIEGESGTGKELLARAIHAASTRRGKEFQVVNCGAIPAELVESELFGHEKGAFTGATAKHIGSFEAAAGGTLFLDEIGDLPLAAQVKLLRALQEGEVKRVGANRPIRVDVRVIAATHRNLASEVAATRFREDLFYRLAVLILHVPPLRQRKGDLDGLTEGLLNRINDQSERAREPGFLRKNLSPDAKTLILNHEWRGNVRELENTLRRAAVWSDGETISFDELKEALLPQVGTEPKQDGILNRPLNQAIDLKAIMDSVAKHYLHRAMQETHGNKSRAAEILGLQSYQTLTNWLERYGIT